MQWHTLKSIFVKNEPRPWIYMFDEMKKKAFGSDKEYEVYKVSQKPFKTKAKMSKIFHFYVRISVFHMHI